MLVSWGSGTLEDSAEKSIDTRGYDDGTRGDCLARARKARLLHELRALSHPLIISCV